MNFNLDPYNLLAGFIFGTLGWGAFAYGRRLDLWQPPRDRGGVDGLPVSLQQRMAALGHGRGVAGAALVLPPQLMAGGFPLAEGAFFGLVCAAHAN
jgi:hypothetical protein